MVWAFSLKRQRKHCFVIEKEQLKEVFPVFCLGRSSTGGVKTKDWGQNLSFCESHGFVVVLLHKELLEKRVCLPDGLSNARGEAEQDFQRGSMPCGAPGYVP